MGNCSVMSLMPVSTMLVSIMLLALRMIQRSHRQREAALTQSVRSRTQERDRERRRESERNRILEMLVSNQPLGTALDAALQLIRSEVPHAVSAIILKRPDGCRMAAGVNVPREWMNALNLPHTIPFEVWKQAQFREELPASLAWKAFNAQLSQPFAGSVCSFSISTPDIGTRDACRGAILLWYPDGTVPAGRDTEVAGIACRLAGLAIEHSRLYEDLNFRAHHDSLTGIPNRILFEERLEHSLNEAAILRQRLAVVFIDLDRFKEINDTLSHRVGDLFLCEVASRIKKSLRPGDTVARIGGDEFMILLAGIGEASEAEDIALRILDAVRQPLLIDGHSLEVSASAGMAIYPDDGTAAGQLQREADAALYCAKDSGRGRLQAFATRDDALDRVRMTEELRVALKNGYFEMHYQPKVRADGTLAGVEALVRMNHPKYGQLAPGPFIPVAESTGLIIPLGTWILDEVCRQSAAWQALGLGQIAVAVNISPLQIARADFAQSVRECLGRHGVSPWHLELELTESLLLEDADEARTQMRELRSIGVRLSIADFSAGCSSLSYLHRLPVDAIKLDKSFIRMMDGDQLANRLVEEMMGVAESLGLTVIAEGVETESQREALLKLGCPSMQGFLFAPPQTAHEMEGLLRKAALHSGKQGKDIIHLAKAVGQLTNGPDHVDASSPEVISV